MNIDSIETVMSEDPPVSEVIVVNNNTEEGEEATDVSCMEEEDEYGSSSIIAPSWHDSWLSGGAIADCNQLFAAALQQLSPAEAIPTDSITQQQNENKNGIDINKNAAAEETKTSLERKPPTPLHKLGRSNTITVTVPRRSSISRQEDFKGSLFGKQRSPAASSSLLVKDKQPQHLDRSSTDATTVTSISSSAFAGGRQQQRPRLSRCQTDTSALLGNRARRPNPKAPLLSFGSIVGQSSVVDHHVMDDTHLAASLVMVASTEECNNTPSVKDKIIVKPRKALTQDLEFCWKRMTNPVRRWTKKEEKPQLKRTSTGRLT